MKLQYIFFIFFLFNLSFSNFCTNVVLNDELSYKDFSGEFCLFRNQNLTQTYARLEIPFYDTSDITLFWLDKYMNNGGISSQIRYSKNKNCCEYQMLNNTYKSIIDDTINKPGILKWKLLRNDNFTHIKLLNSFVNIRNTTNRINSFISEWNLVTETCLINCDPSLETVRNNFKYCDKTCNGICSPCDNCIECISNNDCEPCTVCHHNKCIEDDEKLRMECQYLMGSPNSICFEWSCDINALNRHTMCVPIANQTSVGEMAGYCPGKFNITSCSCPVEPNDPDNDPYNPHIWWLLLIPLLICCCCCLILLILIPIFCICCGCFTLHPIRVPILGTIISLIIGIITKTSSPSVNPLNSTTGTATAIGSNPMATSAETENANPLYDA